MHTPHLPQPPCRISQPARQPSHPTCPAPPLRRRRTAAAGRRRARAGGVRCADARHGRAGRGRGGQLRRADLRQDVRAPRRPHRARGPAGCAPWPASEAGSSKPLVALGLQPPAPKLLVQCFGRESIRLPAISAWERLGHKYHILAQVCLGYAHARIWGTRTCNVPTGQTASAWACCPQRKNMSRITASCLGSAAKHSGGSLQAPRASPHASAHQNHARCAHRPRQGLAVRGSR